VEDKTNNKIGQEFEEETRSFLKKLGFQNVNGGQGFHISPQGSKNQIDACGKFGEVLFVFECKAAGKNVTKNLRQEIKEAITTSKIAYENYKSIPEYKDCKIFKFIFITKKIQIPEEEKSLCRSNHIYYEDYNLIEYYTDLYEKIEDYSIYNFLADFDVYSSNCEGELKINALKTKLGDYEVYNFFANPKELLKFSYVARRRNEKEDFYQRMLDKGRIKKIQKFLDNGGIFPTNIILSLKEGNVNFYKINNTNANSLSEFGILSVKYSHKAFWVIDGQHRLYSFSKSSSSELIPCIAFKNISIEKERGLFLEINKEQKPIQADLIWDLEGLSDESSYKGIISNSVHTLYKKEDNPFFNSIYIPLYGSKTGKIVNMAAFCNGIDNASLNKDNLPNIIGGGNPLRDNAKSGHVTITRRVADTLAKYFSLLSESVNEDSSKFIFSNAGVPIMLYLLEPIISHIKRIPSSGELRNYTDSIVDFFHDNYKSNEDFKELRLNVNSEGSRKNLAKKIGLNIRKKVRDNNFWPEMEADDLIDSIKGIERRLANLISIKLSEFETDWPNSRRVPQDIFRKIKERVSSEGTKFEENLGLGDEMNIIFESNNWKDVFKDIFIKKKDGFENDNELRLAFTYLGKIRNPHSHGRIVMHTRDDIDLCDLYIRKFNKILPEILIETESDPS